MSARHVGCARAAVLDAGLERAGASASSPTSRRSPSWLAAARLRSADAAADRHDGATARRRRIRRPRRWRSIRSTSRSTRVDDFSARRRRCRAVGWRPGGARAARASRAIRYDAVRRAKHEALARCAFDRFLAEEWEQLTPRAAALAAYIARERWWLDDYALFQALSATRRRARRGATGRAPVRDRDPQALDEARRAAARATSSSSSTGSGSPSAVAGRRAAGARRTASPSSATCRSWSAPTAPRCGRAPTSSCSTCRSACRPTRSARPARTGACRPTDWDVDRRGRLCLDPAARARMAALFDGVRVDHLIGLYRTYGRPTGRRAVLHTRRRADADRAGRAVLRMLAGERAGRSSPRISGSSPTFVRASLAAARRAGLQGAAVGARLARRRARRSSTRRRFRRVSAAMTGTHDTEPLAVWWSTTSPTYERAALLERSTG